MKITPLAADSMGCRSMSTFIETKDCAILIDPGAGVGSLRFGLAPHPLEEWCLEKHRERIHMFAQSADVIIITHYHYDHYNPEDMEIYREKTLLVKNPNRKINLNQRNRAFAFFKKIHPYSCEITYVDGRSVKMGGTHIDFSDSVPHGSKEESRFVIQVSIQSDNQIFLFTSDVQGLAGDEAIDFIVEKNPTFLYLDGPITYYKEDAATKAYLNGCFQRILNVIDNTKVAKIILDHHLLRDHHWKDKMKPVFDHSSKSEISIQTAAEFRGEENYLLEARRNRLYEGDVPPKKTF
jgi:predicted metallo-beta-lactamase superfamily hydrolase